MGIVKIIVIGGASLVAVSAAYIIIKKVKSKAKKAVDDTAIAACANKPAHTPALPTPKGTVVTKQTIKDAEKSVWKKEWKKLFGADGCPKSFDGTEFTEKGDVTDYI